MHYKKLGKTDLQVSLICLGTMTWGEQNTEAEAHAQLSYAVDQGINFIDTAELYPVPSKEETQGLTEQYIGTWLKNRSDRDQLIIASKIAGPRPGQDFGHPQDFKPATIRTALENSLKRLQTDYLDLYQLHWPMRRTNFFGKLGYQHSESDPWEDDFLAILQTMKALIQEGKIRHFGISNETPWGLSRFLHLAETHGLPRCVSIQNPYNLLNRSFEVGLAEMAIREQVGLLAYSPMAFGLLSGKYHRGPKPEQGRLSLYKVFVSLQRLPISGSNQALPRNRRQA
jgi:aryl-alcohol dehydrogenase-like predicted oxidoreductase